MERRARNGSKIESHPVTREPDHLAKRRVSGSNPVVRSSKGAGQIGLCRLRRWPLNVPCHTRAIDALPPSTTTVGENDFNRFSSVWFTRKPALTSLSWRRSASSSLPSKPSAPSSPSFSASSSYPEPNGWSTAGIALPSARRLHPRSVNPVFAGFVAFAPADALPGVRQRLQAAIQRANWLRSPRPEPAEAGERIAEASSRSADREADRPAAPTIASPNVPRSNGALLAPFAESGPFVGQHSHSMSQ